MYWLLMHQSFVTIAPLTHTYGEGLGIAGLKCRAITCRVYPQCRGNDEFFYALGSLLQGNFLFLRWGQRAKFWPPSLPPVCAAYSRALKAEMPQSPPFPVGGRAVVTNDLCTIAAKIWSKKETNSHSRFCSILRTNLWMLSWLYYVSAVTH